MNFFEWIVDQDNVTFLIAVVGFLLTTYQLIRNAILSKENYKVSIIDYAKRNTSCIQFLLCVENLSKSPLCISEITLYGTTCELMKKAIRGNPENWNFLHTVDFPVCIQSCSCKYLYVEFLDVALDTFPHIELYPGTAVTFEIRSTHRLVRRRLVLGDISHYLHTTAQHRDYLENHVFPG